MFSSSFRSTQWVRTFWCLFLGVIFAALIGATAPSAQAEAGKPCLWFVQGVELDDGSVIAAGIDCVTKFNADGKVDSGFGSGGVAETPGSSQDGQEGVVDLLEVPDGYVVVRSHSLSKLTTDGALDDSFGGDGLLEATELVPMTGGISRATGDQSGNIFFTGTQGLGGRGSQTVAKMKPSGDLDVTFGEDGVYWDDSPDIGFYIEALGVDSQGRPLVAGTDPLYDRPLDANLIRLTKNGEVDTSFGLMGMATSSPIKNAGGCETSCGVNVSGITVGPDRQISLLGSVSHLNLKSGYSDTFWAEFDPDGDPTATSSADIQSSAPATYRFPNGDLLLSESAGRRVSPDGTGISGWHAFEGTRLAEYEFRAGTFSYNPTAGHILSVGGLFGEPTCEDSTRYRCPNERRAITKIDAETGEAVRSFGGNGTVMTGLNDCAEGFAPQIDGFGPWRRCRLRSPLVTPTVKISAGRTNRPSLYARVELGSPPKHPLFLKQEVRLKLPDRLRLRRRALKPRLTVKTENDAPGSFRTTVRGRTLTIGFTPRAVYPAGYDDPYYDGDPPPPNSPTEVKIHLKRGSLQALPKRLRGRRLTATVSGRVLAQTEDTIPWWGPSGWTQEKVRFRVPR